MDQNAGAGGGAVCYRSWGWALWTRVRADDETTDGRVTAADMVQVDDVQPANGFYAHLLKRREWRNGNWLFTISKRGWENGW